MQRLRSTFKRSRTPTGSEMKSQSSLEVPKQIRSASFDEIQLEAKRQDERRECDRSGTRNAAADFRTVSFLSSSSSSSCSSARSQQDAGYNVKRLATLRVPQLQSGQRSKSFDACSNYDQSDLERGGGGGGGGVSTPTIQVSGCYHCACAEQYKRLYGQQNDASESPLGSSTEDCQEEDGDRANEEVYDDEYSEDEDGESYRGHSPEIRVTLSSADKGSLLSVPTEAGVPDRQRRRSITSPRLSRQEALTSYPIELPHNPSSRKQERQREEEDEEEEEEEEDEEEDDDEEEDEEETAKKGESPLKEEEVRSKLVVRDIFLTVPELKRDRAASVDSCFNNNKADKSDNQDYLVVPQQGTRSKSVDIVLPTDAHTRYTALLPTNESRPLRRDGREGEPSGGQRELRTTPDWSHGALNEEHFWVPTATSGDFCLSHNCLKRGPRLKCSACRGVVHRDCIGLLKVTCKPTFRDVGVRQYREQTTTHHHWIHRRSLKGKCSHCGKSLQSKLSFASKDTVALSCSWCKAAYHNRDPCFDVQKFKDNCDFGIHASIVVPPSWIVKLPRKGSFKSSLRKSPKKKKGSSAAGPVGSSRKKGKEKDSKDEKELDRLWAVKPIPTATARPVLVFINPKSGGNQGAKLLQKFQWFLNPRQVFDLTQGGPKMGLELFKNVPNLRVLACGGDGTVGWILSILDQINVSPPPAVGVLPLGTGNDLARTLGWGGGYTDEPISKILQNVGESETTLLDRWRLTVERNVDAPNDEDGGGGKGKENLPLNVVNNYFSLGVDAHIALEFHEAREAHPEKFNSRLRNKMFYGQMGGKDLLRRKWKDLSEFVTLECDGKDLTPKLKEHRVHAIVFLNIASYGGGTHPWGGGSGGKEPSTDDCLIEVVGLTTYQLPLLQAGGHGTCIAQCKEAKLVTTRTIPMQVDGEACRLLPSVISLNWLNQATMLAKRRNTGKPMQNVGTKLERLRLPLMKITMADYESYHSDKDRLKTAAVACLPEPLDLEATLDLESLRTMLSKEHAMDFCCFLDSCTAERFFRIDRAQEQLHYVTDIAAEALYILDDSPSTQTTDDPSHSNTRKTNWEPDPTRPSSSNERASQESLPKETDGRRASTLRSDERSKREDDKKEPATEPTERKSDPPSGNETRRLSTGSTRQQSIPKPSTSKSSVGPMAYGQSAHHTAQFSFVSPRDRLFGLSSEVHGFNRGLLEKTCDGILKAAKVGDLRTLKELHEQGYSLLSIDANGQTALHLASRYGHKDIVRYLIASAPTDILNIADNDKGQTALHKAALQKRRSICCMLIAGGANLTVRDRRGSTPRELAFNAEDRDLAAYLHSQEQFQLMTESMNDVL